ncbi:MAG: hypothetical protein AMXMBFR7_32540 [Planctomycetota bacterium]
MKASIRWTGGTADVEFVTCRVIAKGPETGRLDVVLKKPLGLEWPSALAKALELDLQLVVPGDAQPRKGLKHSLPGNEMVISYPGQTAAGSPVVPEKVELHWTKLEEGKRKIAEVSCSTFDPTALQLPIPMPKPPAGCLPMLLAGVFGGVAAGARVLS